jgi:hypothetical protein
VNGFNSAIQSLSTFASPMVAAGLLSFFPIQVLMFIDVITAAIGILIVFFCVHTHKGWRRPLQAPAAGVVPLFDADVPGEAGAVVSGVVDADVPGKAGAAVPSVVGADVPGEAGAAVSGVVGAAVSGEAEVGEGLAGEGLASATLPGGNDQGLKPGFFPEFKAGLLYVVNNKFILAFMAMGVVFNILAVPPALLTPLQVALDFGQDPWRLGAIEVVFSVGMMAGGAIIGVWGGFKNRAHTLAFSTLFFGLGTIGLGLLGNFWVYLACMLFVGITMPIFNAPMMGILQEKIDPDFMGRVFSVFMMIGSFAMPFGMLFFGPLAEVVPVDWLLVASGTGIALLVFYILGNRHIREAGMMAVPAGDATVGYAGVAEATVGDTKVGVAGVAEAGAGDAVAGDAGGAEAGAGDAVAGDAGVAEAGAGLPEEAALPKDDTAHKA